MGRVLGEWVRCRVYELREEGGQERAKRQGGEAGGREGREEEGKGYFCLVLYLWLWF